MMSTKPILNRLDTIRYCARVGCADRRQSHRIRYATWARVLCLCIGRARQSKQEGSGIGEPWQYQTVCLIEITSFALASGRGP